MSTPSSNWAKTLAEALFSNASITASLTFLVALVLMLATGGPMIAWLKNKRWRKQGESWTVREDTPDTHQAKQGTPSMGGIGIIGSTVLAFIGVLATVFALISFSTPNPVPPGGWLGNVLILLLLPFTFIAHGLLGFADDWSKASGRGGLRARAKIFFQFALATASLLGCIVLQNVFSAVAVGGNPNFLIDLRPYSDLLPVLMILAFLIIFMIGTCNAVNLTDGLDGLASGLAVATCGALALTALGITKKSEAVAMLFCAALMGACLGFLNFNKYKARVFMGDTGSLAIGAGIAAASILLHAVWLLPFVGFMFYVEAASVTIQVLWFKWTKRQTGEGQRLFRRAPLHHHFELAGWSEWRVVLTFWVVNLLTTAIGLILWYLKVLPRFP